MTPWIGVDVSVAKIRIIEKLTLVNLSAEKPINNYYFPEPPDDIKELTVWSHLNTAFSRPVDRNKFHALYAATQIISELFKAEGFDGIKFKSSAAPGHCYVLFDIDKASVEDTYICRINDLDVSFEYTGLDSP